MTLKEFKSMAQRFGKTYDNTENAKKCGLVHGAWIGGVFYGDIRNIHITVILIDPANTICVTIMLHI